MYTQFTFYIPLMWRACTTQDKINRDEGPLPAVYSHSSACHTHTYPAEFIPLHVCKRVWLPSPPYVAANRGSFVILFHFTNWLYLVQGIESFISNMFISVYISAVRLCV